MFVSSPEKQAEVEQSGPYQTQPRAGGDGRDFIHPRAVGPAPGEERSHVADVSLPAHSVLLSQSLKTVWQLWFQAVDLEAWSPHSVSVISQDGPLQVRALSEPLAACGPLRFPESKGGQVPSPLNCSKVQTAKE